jgi:hypothetical protein
VAEIEAAGFGQVRVLERTRNARTKNAKAYICAVEGERG